MHRPHLRLALPFLALAITMVAACNRSGESVAQAPERPTAEEEATSVTCDAFVQHQTECKNAATPAQMKAMCVASLGCAKKTDRQEAVQAITDCLTRAPCDVAPAECSQLATRVPSSASFRAYVAACTEKRVTCSKLSCKNLEAASVLSDRVFDDARACFKNATCDDAFQCVTSAMLEPLREASSCVEPARDAFAAVASGRPVGVSQGQPSARTEPRLSPLVDAKGFLGVTISMPKAQLPKGGERLLSQPPTEVWSYPPATYGGRAIAMSELSFTDDRMVEASFVIAECDGLSEMLEQEYGPPMTREPLAATWRASTSELLFSAGPEHFGRCEITLKSAKRWSGSLR